MIKKFFLFLSIFLLLPLTGYSAEGVPSNLEIQIHVEVNKVRNQQNQALASLVMHSTLIEVARAHSEDMLENNFFAHENLDGLSPGDRVTEANVPFSEVRENLFTASGYTEDEIANLAVQGWIDSEGHFINMLSETHYTGIGVASRGGEYYITQIFVEASLSEMSSNGILYNNEDLRPINDNSSFLERNLELLVFAGILLAIILIGRDASVRNRRVRYRSRSRIRRFNQ